MVLRCDDTDALKELASGIAYAGICRVCHEGIMLFNGQYNYTEYSKRGLTEDYNSYMGYILVHTECKRREDIAKKVAARLNGTH